MKIIKHGVTLKQIPVFTCDNCGLVAILDRKEIKSNSMACPECFEESSISFMETDEIKEMKKEIKEEK